MTLITEMNLPDYMLNQVICGYRIVAKINKFIDNSADSPLGVLQTFLESMMPAIVNATFKGTRERIKQRVLSRASDEAVKRFLMEGKRGEGNIEEMNIPLITEMGFPEDLLKSIISGYRIVVKIDNVMTYGRENGPLLPLISFLNDMMPAIVKTMVDGNFTDEHEELERLVLSDASDVDVMRVLLER